MNKEEKTFDELAIGHLLKREKELGILQDAEFSKVRKAMEEGNIAGMNPKVSREIQSELHKIQDQIIEYYQRQGKL